MNCVVFTTFMRNSSTSTTLAGNYYVCFEGLLRLSNHEINLNLENDYLILPKTSVPISTAKNNVIITFEMDSLDFSCLWENRETPGPLQHQSSCRAKGILASVLHF